MKPFTWAFYIMLAGHGHSQWLRGSRIHLQCRKHRRCRFDFWVGKIPWRRKTHSSILPEKFHGQRRLVGYSPKGLKEWNTPKQPSMDMSQEGNSRSHKADRNRGSEVLFCHFCCIVQVKVNLKDRPDSKVGKYLDSTSFWRSCKDVYVYVCACNLSHPDRQKKLGG